MRWVLVWLIGASGLLGCGAPPPRYALVVGVDTYQAPGIASLKGARNDARAVAALLRGRFGFDHVQLIEDATRAQLVAGLDALIAKARPGAQLVFHFSGHGTQVRDQDGDEADEWDEALVPADSGRMGDPRHDLTDDTLAVYASRAADAGAALTVILDSCHSGTGLRDGEPVRAAPPVGDVGRSPPVGGRIVEPGGVAPYALLTAAAAGERAREVILPDGRRHGALTWALVDALRRAPTDATWRQIMARVRFAVGGRFPQQHPQLEGLGADRVVFGRRAVAPTPGFAVEVVRGQVRIAAGSALGLSVGARLEVMAEGATVGALTVTAATPWTAQARLRSGAVPAGAHARLVEAAAPPNQLTVGLPNAHSALRAAVAQWPQLVGQKPGSGTVDVDALSDGRLALRIGARRVGDPVADDAAGRRALVRRLNGWARWFALHDLQSEDSLPLRFEVEGPSPIRVGDTLELVVRNEGRRSLFVGLLALDDAGGVEVLYPAPGAEETLAAGAVWRRPLEAYEASRNLLKLVVTTAPFDLGALALEPGRGAVSPGHPLNRWLGALAHGVRAGGAVSLATDSWAVREVLVEVLPPGP